MEKDTDKPCKKKIFISYGRKDAQQLAFKLEQDLKQEGHDVWLDKKEIQTGESWEQQIEDGILNADIFIALLSPHAVRRPDGVCLDEISMARYNSRKIIPAMVMMCRPPLGIYRLDWVDFQNWKTQIGYDVGYNRLLDSFDKDVVSEGIHSRIFSELKPLDFGVDIANLIRDFTGRKWLLKEFEEWLATDNRVFFITGDPGIGKSGILAFLVQYDPQVVAYHFCKSSLTDSLNPIRFVQSIAAQLATQLENYRGSLEAIDFEEILSKGESIPNVLFRRIIADPLKSESLDKPVLIVVDGIDEALQEKHPNIIEVLRDRLQDLPKNVRFVISSRKEPEVLDLFGDFKEHEIEGERSENLQDVETYLMKKLNEPEIAQKISRNGISVKNIVEIITKKSDGNFLYAVNAVKAIQDDLIDIASPEIFPPGLIGMYNLFFGRIFPKETQTYKNYRPILDVILAAHAPLTTQQIGDFLERDSFDIEQELQKLASFFPERDGYYQTYHKSLADWLLGLAGRDKTYRINVQAGHKCIANALLESYKANNIDEYLLVYLPKHLLALKRWKTLTELLSDLNFIETCFTRKIAHFLIKNYLEALENKTFPDVDQNKIRDFKKFVFSQLYFLQKHPHLTAQQAINQPEVSVVGDYGREYLDHSQSVKMWFEWINKPKEQDPCIATITGHEYGIKASAFSQDGLRILTASTDHTLKLWDVETGAEIKTFSGHMGGINGCAISPDETKIVSASDDQSVKLWDIDSKIIISSLTGHAGVVHACAFSPDSSKILSASVDSTLKLWDVKTGNELHTFQGHSSGVYACLFSPDGTKLLSASNDATLRLWDVATGAEIRKFIGHKGGVWACSYSSDGTKILSASTDHTLKLWDAETGNEIRTFNGHSRGVYGCDFSPDESKILSISNDLTMKIWDVNTGRERKTYTGHSDWIYSCSFSPDGEKILSTSRDGTFKLWDANIIDLTTRFSGHSRAVWACKFSPDDTKFLTGSDDTNLILWDINTGNEILKLTGHFKGVYACDFSPDGTKILSASDDQTLKLWNPETGEEIRTYTGHEGGVYSCAFSPCGTKFVSASADQTLKLWDVDSGEILKTFSGHSYWVAKCVFSPDGTKILSASRDKTLKLWDIEIGNEIKTLTGHLGGVTSCAFSLDGSKILSASRDGTLIYWDMKTGKEIRTLKAVSSGGVFDCKFTSDGKNALSSSRDGKIKLWNLDTGEEILSFPTKGVPISISTNTQNKVGIGDENGSLYLLELRKKQ